MSGLMKGLKVSPVRHRRQSGFQCFRFELTQRVTLARRAKGSNMSSTAAHSFNAGNPSILRPMSNDVSSTSVLLCDHQTYASVFLACP